MRRTLLLALLVSALLTGRAQAFSLSFGVNYDLTTDTTGAEMTAILPPDFGYRYSQSNFYPLLSYTKLYDDRIETGEVMGTLQLHHVMWLLDYKSFTTKSNMPFDFLTAYVSAIYGNGKVMHQSNTVTPSGGLMNYATLEEELSVEYAGSSFGFYGGQKFLFVDARIELLKITLKDTTLEQPGNHLRFLLGLAVGF